MGLSHKTLPVHGVQFHPESIASEHGHLILKNFLDLAAAWNARKDGAASRPASALRRGMIDEFKALIAKAATGAALTREEAAHAFDRMMSGEATPSQMGGAPDGACACAAKPWTRSPARSARCAPR